VKDIRYRTTHILIEGGHINTLSEIFYHIPKSIVVTDSGINWNRLSSKIKNPDKFTIKDIRILAKLFDIDIKRMFDLIIAAPEKPSKKR
jgi:hypothetical protein